MDKEFKKLSRVVKRLDSAISSRKKEDIEKAYNYFKRNTKSEYFNGRKPSNYKELTSLVKDMKNEISTDLMNVSIMKGDVINAERYSKEITNVKTTQDKIITKNAKKLATAQRNVVDTSNLSKREIEHIESKNKHGVKGLGKENILDTIIDRDIKTQKGINKVLNEFKNISHQEIKKEIQSGFYTRTVEIYFNSIEIIEHDKLNQWKSLVNQLDYKGILEMEDYLFNVLPCMNPSDSIDFKDDEDKIDLMKERLNLSIDFARKYIKNHLK